MNNIVVRKVKVLQGIAKALAEKYDLKPDDLVILSVSMEKIIGDPVSYLLSQMEDEGCPHDVPVHLRGKANVCLAGGPKTEDYPGGQFCSHLETVGKCKLDIKAAEA